MIISCGKLSGEFSRPITVQTNDPEHATTTLYCKGKILEPFTMSPKRVNFGRVSRKELPPAKTYVLTPGDGGPLKPELDQANLPEFVKAELKEVEPGQRYELNIGLKPPIKTAAIRGKLKLKTGIESAPEATIPFYGSLLPRVTANPSRIIIPRERDADWDQPIQLVWDDDQKHQILSATVNDPNLSVDVKDKEGDQQVVLHVPEGFDQLRAMRSITIRTSDKLSPNLRVGVSMARVPRASVPRATRMRTLPNRASDSGAKKETKAAQPPSASDKVPSDGASP